MAIYKYTAVDDAGKQLRGVVNAQSEAELQEKLRADGKYLQECQELERNLRSKRLRSDHLADFALSMSKLLKAGVTMVRALDIVAEDEATAEKEREIYRDLLKIVKQGRPLSSAMADQGDTFPPLFINMMHSAENSGGMEETMLQLSDYYAKEYRLNQKIKSAMTYPKILSVMIVIVVAIIVGFVIPQFKDLFDAMGQLPLATTILLAVSDFVAHKWYVIIFIAAVVVLFLKLLFSIPKLKIWKSKVEVHLPVIGNLRKVVYTARFARTLASLYSAGMPILNCLSIARTTIGNAYIEKQFDQVIASISAGENLSVSLNRVDGFTKKLTSIIMVGEETGALNSMLVSMADQLDYESEMATQRLVTMLEPVMIVVMAVIVGFIMIAVIQPIYGSYQTIANSGH
ncbi:MAG: type II secretion system F family protein [Lachnospiraceae bacterium]|nr:type II secretion system F family protein [Lachnospiraceae bacterium]